MSLLALGAVLLPPATVAADDAATDIATAKRRVARRHEGPQFRMSLGPSSVYTHQSLDGGSHEISANGMLFEFAVGEMIGQAVSLHVDLALFYAAEAQSSGAVEPVSFTAVHAGVGATYWFMPANIYATGSFGLASSSVESGRISIVGDVDLPYLEVSHVGAGLHLGAGKQWWVSRRTGLGLSASLLAMEMASGQGKNVGPRLLIGASVMATLSYR